MVGEGDVAGSVLLAVHHLLLRPTGRVVQPDAVIHVGCDHQIVLAMEVQGVDAARIILAAAHTQHINSNGYAARIILAAGRTQHINSSGYAVAGVTEAIERLLVLWQWEQP